MSGAARFFGWLRAGSQPRLLILLSHKKPVGCIIEMFLTCLRQLDNVSGLIEIPLVVLVHLVEVYHKRNRAPFICRSGMPHGRLPGGQSE
jgi:hypothetical protein